MVALRWSIRANTYHDSIKLMRVSEALARGPGVRRAAAVMATPLNLELLGQDGLLTEDAIAGPDDLVIAVEAETDAAAAAAITRLDALLAPQPDHHPAHTPPPRTVEFAASTTDANLALIATPGRYAAVEAYAAVYAGLHVFLFSDNVSIEDEVRLKRLAAERDLLMMGPDCGTAIVAGTGLGFANRVDRGPVGIVGASGTGIQQVCCLLDGAGAGVAQAIGTGGRDLSGAVGGSMTLRALRLLDDDPAVRVVVVISKPPDAGTARRLHEAMLGLRTPAIACLLGAAPRDEGQVRYAATLLDAARLACGAVGLTLPATHGQAGLTTLQLRARGRVYGLFAGGTLRSEAGQVLDRLGAPHELLDLGDDRYTRGRAHPMIDPRLRQAMIEDLAGRDDLGVLLLDVILGDLAHPDPAGALLPALQALHRRRDVPVIATLVGARRDPQGLDTQAETLRAGGALVFPANALAAEAAARLVGLPR